MFEVATIILGFVLWFFPSPYESIQKRLTNTDIKRIVFEHHKLRTMHQGHQAKSVQTCTDGDCKLIG